MINIYIKAIKIYLEKEKIQYIQEYKFHSKRKWRVDFFLTKKNIAIEFEGGIFSRGRHTRGKGFANDCKKYNELALCGIRLIRITSEDFKLQNINYLENIFQRIIEF